MFIFYCIFHFMKKRIFLSAAIFLLALSACRKNTYSCQCNKSNGETEIEGTYKKTSTKKATTYCQSKSDADRTCNAIFPI